MNEPSTVLRQLLAERDVRIVDWRRDTAQTIARTDTTRYLAKRYRELEILRKRLFHPDGQNSDRNGEISPDVWSLGNELSKRWLISKTEESSPVDTRTRFPFAPIPEHLEYLNGGWLEELGFLAYREAGADEVWRGVKVQWNVDAHEGRNEIDIVARRGNMLSLASCKAIEAMPTPATTKKLMSFLSEMVVWDHHFSNGAARSILLVTSDLIDEINGNRPRLPSIMGRATLFDIDILGHEQMSWTAIVKAVGAHWDGA